MKNSIKYFLIIFLVLISIIIGVFLLKSNFTKKTLEDKENSNYNENPVYTEHSHEFNIINSNYLERFYERYNSYKKKHSEYDDDTIITYVNIGLDKEFYTSMEDTDLNDGILILCNKYHTLKKNYVPDLASLDGYGGGQLEKVTASFFKKMSDAAKKEGLTIKNVSGYRSYSTQSSLYNNYVSQDGRAKADTYSARPGTSEHQTGLASDINWVSNSFENTNEFKWLQQNAYKYGFILRYPKGKSFITGYVYEPWHYRYVGLEVAKYIHEHDITYEEYYATFILK